MITYGQLAYRDKMEDDGGYDPNEAPVGYRAVLTQPPFGFDRSCALCALYPGEGYYCASIGRCLSRNRNDGRSVFFVRR